ncbi:glycerol-3-phosphate acyltransferase PlsY [Verrucomicrobium sp. GAS474]|nr:glycerol-3-phosphate acyltransferase PlsY [Verrucomicrobium sp. GAS474]
MAAAVMLCFSFLIGSIPFGFLLGKWNGLDLRKHGSGNIGATNVWRVLGWKWGLPAFLLDFFKGFLPAFIFVFFVPHGRRMEWEVAVVLIGLVATLGHNFTPWLGGKGGKGVATSAGAIAAFMPEAFLVILAVWGASFWLTRIVSLASILASAVLPVAAFVLYPNKRIFFVFGLLAGGMTILRHRANIERLLRGEEKRMGSPKAK